MKTFARFALKILALFVPVVIAACYGVGARYNGECGKVDDAQTKQPITNIWVTCLHNDVVVDQTSTYSDGRFCFYLNDQTDTCMSLVFHDENAPAVYPDQTVTLTSQLDSVGTQVFDLNK